MEDQPPPEQEEAQSAEAAVPAEAEAVSSTAPPPSADEVTGMDVEEAPKPEESGVADEPSAGTEAAAVPESEGATEAAADSVAKDGEDAKSEVAPAAADAPAAEEAKEDVEMVEKPEEETKPKVDDEEERKANEKRKAEAAAAAEALAAKRAKWEEKRRELYDPMITATQGLHPKDVMTCLEGFGLKSGAKSGDKAYMCKLFILGACEKAPTEEYNVAVEKNTQEKLQHAAAQETEAAAENVDGNVGLTAEAMQAYYQQIGEPEDDGTSPFMGGGYGGQGYGPTIGQPSSKMIRPSYGNPFGKHNMMMM